MSPKRLERVAPPPVGEEWDVKFGDSKAAKNWPELCACALVAAREAFELMRENLAQCLTACTTSSAAS